MGLEIPNRDRALVMGVLNVTPASFFDGGKFLSHEDAVAHAMTLIRDGADIIDVGGESTRPYSQPTSVREELKRVVPVIEGPFRDTHFYRYLQVSGGNRAIGGGRKHGERRERTPLRS